MSSLEAREAAPIIETEGLGKSFTTPALVEAVRGVSLRLLPGELAALVGPSGAGKSTLLALLSGLMSPTNGRVTVNGAELSGLGAESRARARNLGIGFVFQYHHLLPELTALENVLLPGLIAAREGWRDTPVRDLERRAASLLDAVGLDRRHRHLPTQLSGGEAQRAALARALMNEPAVVMADEPTGNLDQKTAVELMDMIQRLNRDEGQTFLIATHNQELMNRASRVLRMINGELTT